MPVPLCNVYLCLFYDEFFFIIIDVFDIKHVVRYVSYCTTIISAVVAVDYIVLTVVIIKDAVDDGVTNAGDEYKNR
jgi:hypothetical protein